MSVQLPGLRSRLGLGASALDQAWIRFFPSAELVIQRGVDGLTNYSHFATSDFS